MSLLGLKTFRHGIHPPEAKDATSALPIRQFPFAPLLVVPLIQHLGKAGKASLPVVREDETVVRGQCIARPDGFMSVAMHAPASGTVRKIALAPAITGRMVPAVYLEPQPGSTQEVMGGRPCALETATNEEIISAVQQAGVVGLGGAAFPTHVKLGVPEGKQVDTLILNGAECEPYLTTDHRVMLEQREDLFLGIRYLLKVTGASLAILAIEANKPDAAEHLRAGLPADLPARVEVLRVKYPQGAEKMLVKALLGREVPSGGLPLDVHALCVNVATTAPRAAASRSA
jgi:electron transport complex protein RnfC